MTGRRAYEMFTRAFGEMYSHHRKNTQFPNSLIAYDDLGWMEQGAWRNIAKQIDNVVKRSKAASS